MRPFITFAGLALAGFTVAAVPAAAQNAPSQGAPSQGAPSQNAARKPSALLTVVPPPGYVAESMPPRPGQGARFSVKLPADKDTGCQVAFTPAPQNNKFTQAELDATMRAPEWQNMAKAALAAAYEVGDAKVVEGEGGPFYTVEGDIKERPNLPARAKDIRTLFVIRETPRGRTSTVCVGDKADFNKRRADFAAVAAGARTP